MLFVGLAAAEHFGLLFDRRVVPSGQPRLLCCSKIQLRTTTQLLEPCLFAIRHHSQLTTLITCMLVSSSSLLRIYLVPEPVTESVVWLSCCTIRVAWIEGEEHKDLFLQLVCHPIASPLIVRIALLHASWTHVARIPSHSLLHREHKRYVVVGRLII